MVEETSPKKQAKIFCQTKVLVTKILSLELKIKFQGCRCFHVKKGLFIKSWHMNEQIESSQIKLNKVYLCNTSPLQTIEPKPLFLPRLVPVTS